MRMMIVEDEDFELELNKSVNAKVEIIPAKGRNGASATPESLRKLIANDILDGGNMAEVAEAYGVSRSSASAYANGATSTASYDKPANGLGEFVDAKRDKIKTRAQNKLLLALKHITDDKLTETKVVELSTIAANMSRVVEKTTPKTKQWSITTLYSILLNKLVKKTTRR